MISLSPGRKLKLHSNKRILYFSLDDVQRIVTFPVKEKMMKRWRHLKAGQTAREEVGLPYPIRHFEAKLFLHSGKIVSGRLYTTVFYLDSGGDISKLILYAKKKGDEGETFSDIIYPQSISLSRRGEVQPQTKITSLNVIKNIVADTDISFLSIPELVVFASKVREDKSVILPVGLSEHFIVAVVVDKKILVEISAKSDDKLILKTQKAADDARDFFEVKEVLSAWNGDEDYVFSLVRLTRKDKTTYQKGMALPFRIGVWRWKVSSEGKLLLSGRGCLFRTIRKTGEEIPQIELVNVFRQDKDD
jgi:hypothetical protein